MLIKDRWRPPLPHVPATPVTAFSVQVDPPDYGWIKFKVTADRQMEEFSPSHCFFQLDSIKDWLEAIALGENPCIHMDAEGWWIYMMVTSTDIPDTVRFNVTFGFSAKPPARPTLYIWPEYRGAGSADLVIERILNVTLPRRRLVEAFYDGLLEVWEKPDQETFWYMWYLDVREWAESYMDDEEYPATYFDIRSKIVDTYLAGTG